MTAPIETATACTLHGAAGCQACWILTLEGEAQGLVACLDAVREAYDPTEALYELGEAWHQLSHDWTFGLASGYTPAQQARIDELVAEAAAAGVDLTFDDETGRWYATPA